MAKQPRTFYIMDESHCDGFSTYAAALKEVKSLVEFNGNNVMLIVRPVSVVRGKWHKPEIDIVVEDVPGETDGNARARPSPAFRRWWKHRS